MGVAAQFDPQTVQAQDFAKTLGPEKIGAPFVERDDVLVVNLGEYPFLFAPDPGAVRPFVALVTIGEELLPVLGGAASQCLAIMLHLQQ